MCFLVSPSSLLRFSAGFDFVVPSFSPVLLISFAGFCSFLLSCCRVVESAVVSRLILFFSRVPLPSCYLCPESLAGFFRLNLSEFFPSLVLRFSVVLLHLLAWV